jgi:hypothetical protein
MLIRPTNKPPKKVKKLSKNWYAQKDNKPTLITTFQLSLD